MDPHAPDHVDGGMAHDLPRLLSRRRALALLGGGGLALLAACSGGTSDSTADGRIPAETGGPFPADGSNGPNVLAEAGVVRRDIRTSIGDARGTAQGLPMTVRLRVVDASNGEPLEGAAVYLWQCDRNGDYSLYSPAAADQNYLRGIQVAGDDGRLEFLSVFPGCYPGRWPHLHVEVYPSLEQATASGRPLRTTQIALPQDTCEQVYARDGYAPSLRYLAEVSLERDISFADGYARQLARMSGSNEQGWTAELELPV